MRWFFGFQISSALDERRPLSERLRLKVQGSSQLKQFVEGSAELEQRLRSPISKESQAAPGLHRDIMKRVRAAAAEKHRPETSASAVMNWTRPLFAGAALLLAAGALVWWFDHASATSAKGGLNLQAATQAIEFGTGIAQPVSLPETDPLSKELSGLKTDLRATGEFLLGSLP